MTTTKKKRAANETRWPEKSATRALELPPGILDRKPKEIAAYVKAAAERSRTKKGTSRQAAIGWVNFLLNRAGKSMEEKRRSRLERAKLEIQRLFDA